MGMEEPPKVDHIDIPPSAIEQMIEGMEEQDDKLDEDAAEKTFIMAVDPSDGFDRETLVARFPVSMTTMLRKVAKAYLHVYLYVEEALPEPETVEVVVHERRLNGDVGDAVATKTVTLQRSTKVVVPLKSSDVERWWRSDPILGLYVVAMLNGQNIAVHPQEDRHARHVSLFFSLFL
ncbi:hypothetical protein ANCCAN_19717 [Ancylostoma caninum]|uniref:TGF-beta propeptide n=1 Tax=Ancylostoma caninum TaxID=29170 RepID=A0A368FVY7_ANCCA|nr:hypothetical protein ANCCAN_19717 [Ancylostoma caninum]